LSWLNSNKTGDQNNRMSPWALEKKNHGRGTFGIRGNVLYSVAWV
jgi:hypothetical protein